MTNNELAYGLLEEIRANLLPLIEKEPNMSYREIVERALEREDDVLNGLKERDLWHTVKLQRDVCYFENIKKQHVQFLLRFKDQLSSR
ncbi:hypothetical protein MM326_18635 [Alkalihalobacillus sp. LMS6]|uniref:hypothetical protein n=1 Tax=Alkalihalobacillus sp. LMS6 TaxID=2924034 RepID=UPI0020D02333|nr:hypothetical protein [Alkalihalobacillus sp. LMS6]UTR06071.1 hypothetical protein MM326_18635 [Alkalihalobacillus sp. LMS6]